MFILFSVLWFRTAIREIFVVSMFCELMRRAHPFQSCSIHSRYTFFFYLWVMEASFVILAAPNIEFCFGWPNLASVDAVTFSSGITCISHFSLIKKKKKSYGRNHSCFIFFYILLDSTKNKTKYLHIWRL